MPTLARALATLALIFALLGNLPEAVAGWGGNDGQGGTCDLSRPQVALAVANAASEWVYANLFLPSVDVLIRRDGIEAHPTVPPQISAQIIGANKIRITPILTTTEIARTESNQFVRLELRLVNLDRGIPDRMELQLDNLGEDSSRRGQFDPLDQRRCRMRVVNPNWQGSQMLMFVDVNSRSPRFFGIPVLFHYGDFTAHVNP